MKNLNRISYTLFISYRFSHIPFYFGSFLCVCVFFFPTSKYTLEIFMSWPLRFIHFYHRSSRSRMHCIPPAVKYLDVPIVLAIIVDFSGKEREAIRVIEIEWPKHHPKIPLKIVFSVGKPISIRANGKKNVDLIWKQIEMTQIKTATFYDDNKITLVFNIGSSSLLKQFNLFRCPKPEK